jgi:iron complex outermembrane receptor protein
MTLYRISLLSGLLTVLCVAHAQEPGTPSATPATQSTARPAAHATPLAPVHVTAVAQRGYHADTAQVDTFGSFGNAPLQDTPAAITVITRDQLDDRQPRTLSELVRADAAVGDNYAPVGYYQDVAIRGFVLDLATAYRMNEIIINGEQLTPLEDKQRVEILKGLGGLQAGVVAPGGMINYVTKRPADVHSATLGTDSHGSRHVAVDVGGWLSPSFGVRVNVAHEDMHSYVQHTPGRRNFLALAADWKISARATLRLDTNYQSSGQRSVSGYQLLGGTTIPVQPDRSRLLGYEPWQQPVGIDSSNTTARFDYRFSDQWQAQLAAGHSHTVIDDNLAHAVIFAYENGLNGHHRSQPD